jgi:hypothetical protein
MNRFWSKLVNSAKRCMVPTLIVWSALSVARFIFDFRLPLTVIYLFLIGAVALFVILSVDGVLKAKRPGH